MINSFRSLAFLLSMTLISFFSFGQSPDGMEQMESSHFEEAIQSFEDDLIQKKNSILANYGLAKIYSDSTFSGLNLEKSWNYYLAFDEDLKNLKEKKRNKLKKENKLKTSKLKNHISETALENAIHENKVKSFDHFLEVFNKSKSSLRKKAILHRNRLAFKNAKELNTSKALGTFIEKYKKSLKTKTPKIWKEVNFLFFEIAMKESKWNSYNDFVNNHPKNPYSKDSGGDHYSEIHNLKDKKKYIDFLDRYPRSLFKKFALHQIGKLLIQTGTEEEFNWFLVSYPNHEFANDLWKNYFYMYVGNHGEASARDFARAYPQYPFMKDIEKVIGAENERSKAMDYEKIRYSNNPYHIIQFLEKHPDSEFSTELIQLLANNLLNHPSIFVYEKALQLDLPTEFRKNIISKLYDLYSYNLSYDGLKGFIDKYGALYQDSTRVKKDLGLAERLVGIIKTDYSEFSENEFDQFIKDAAPYQAAFIALTKTMEEDFKNKNWSIARKKIKKYQSYFKDESHLFNQLEEVLTKPNQIFALTKLTNKINTDGSEFAPVISADGQTLFYCGKNRDDNLGREDIYFSNNNNQVWSTSNLLPEINTPFNNEAPEAISIDGTKMLLFQGGQLVVSNKTKTGWTEIVPLPKTINAENWQADASISSDNRALLFASQRNDLIGFPTSGNLDIYVCLKNENGEWDQVINLGHQINTPYTDRSPFLHPDMKTLYFSSAGHGGLGKLDVYMTTRLDDTWMNWSTPVNLGREINTIESDWGYKISTDGETAFFSFAPQGQKNEDIYKVKLPKELRPELVSTISGFLKDSDGNPLDAQIVIEDLSTKEIVAELQSNPETGEFFVVLPGGRKYSYFIRKENYFPISNNLDLTENKRIELKENLELFTVAELSEKGISITLENIFFDTDKYDLKPESFPELNRVINLIKANNFRIELSGHTDSDGSDAYNLTLSQNRANAVKNYFSNNGIPIQDIVATGFGEANPIDSNSTTNGKAKNRRVEIMFKLK